MAAKKRKRPKAKIDINSDCAASSIAKIKEQIAELRQQLCAKEAELTALKAANRQWLAKLMRECGIANVTISRIREALHKLSKDSPSEKADFSIRASGSLCGSAFFLGATPECQWEIVRDEMNCWCLKLKNNRMS